MPIKVVNVKTWKGNGTHIGRGSIFGNPFTNRRLEDTKAKYQVATRDEAVERYREWAKQQWVEDEFFRISLIALTKDYLAGKDIVLACYCVPERCHGEVIKELVEWLAEMKVVTLDGNQEPF